MKRFVIIFVMLIITLSSSCVVPKYCEVGYYERVYSTCPEHPEYKHYRAIGKGFDPTKCNFIN